MYIKFIQIFSTIVRTRLGFAMTCYTTRVGFSSCIDASINKGYWIENSLMQREHGEGFLWRRSLRQIERGFGRIRNLGYEVLVGRRSSRPAEGLVVKVCLASFQPGSGFRGRSRVASRRGSWSDVRRWPWFHFGLGEARMRVRRTIRPSSRILDLLAGDAWVPFDAIGEHDEMPVMIWRFDFLCLWEVLGEHLISPRYKTW